MYADDVDVAQSGAAFSFFFVDIVNMPNNCSADNSHRPPPAHCVPYTSHKQSIIFLVGENIWLRQAHLVGYMCETACLDGWPDIGSSTFRVACWTSSVLLQKVQKCSLLSWAGVRSGLFFSSGLTHIWCSGERRRCVGSTQNELQCPWSLKWRNKSHTPTDRLTVLRHRGNCYNAWGFSYTNNTFLDFRPFEGFCWQ